jgi:hypothetical protein
MPTYIKDPDAVLDYGFDWSDWLAVGETIATSTWTFPAGITQDSANNSTTSTGVWVSGGTVGQTYEIVNHIITSAGRKDDRTLMILVLQR